MEIICVNCKKKINKIQYKPFCFCSISQCQCQDGGYELVIPFDDYEENELKCPECGEYPFKYLPYQVQKYAQVGIREKAVEDIIDEIL